MASSILNSACCPNYLLSPSAVLLEEQAAQKKRQILCDNNITNNRLSVFVDEATKRPNKMKEQVPDNVVLRDSEDANKSLAYEANNSDDDDSHL